MTCQLIVVVVGRQGTAAVVICCLSVVICCTSVSLHVRVCVLLYSRSCEDKFVQEHGVARL